MSGTRMNVVQVYRTATPNTPPAPNVLLEGEFAVEMADPVRVWCGVPVALDPTGRKLLYDRNVALQGLLVEHDASLSGDGTVALPLTVIRVDEGTY